MRPFLVAAAPVVVLLFRGVEPLFPGFGGVVDADLDGDLDGIDPGVGLAAEMAVEPTAGTGPGVVDSVRLRQLPPPSRLAFADGFFALLGLIGQKFALTCLGQTAGPWVASGLAIPPALAGPDSWAPRPSPS